VVQVGGGLQAQVGQPCASITWPPGQKMSQTGPQPVGGWHWQVAQPLASTRYPLGHI
jgi:hypothetical protein